MTLVPWDMPCHPATEMGDFQEEAEYKLRPEDELAGVREER